SCAALRALAETASGVHEPACAVESSRDWYLTEMSPALPPTCSSASLMPFTIAVVCGRDAPCSGSDEYTVTDEALSPPPPPLLLPPLSSSPPQAATPNASAATRQPEAAQEREIKEPLLRSRMWAAI